MPPAENAGNEMAPEGKGTASEPKPQLSPGPQQRTMAQRHVLEVASTAGLRWLKQILDVEHHSNEELARSLTDSPLKVRCRRPIGSFGGHAGARCLPACLLAAAFQTAVPPAHLPSAAPSACPPACLQPFWVAQAQAILFYHFTKTACLVGRAKGEGFLVTRCALLWRRHPSAVLAGGSREAGRQPERPKLWLLI